MSMPAVPVSRMTNTVRPSLKGHIEIARLDHWVKNVFVLPGIIIALAADRTRISHWSWFTFAIGFLAICLIASSNYVINEVLDAPSDLHHPYKRNRPIPAGRASIPLAYAEWILLMVAGLGISWGISWQFSASLAALWIMGCLYNIRPFRTKDLPYVDVLSEAVNNPLRMLLGWYLTGSTLIPPASLLLGYWMVGCYFMAIKRFAEYRELADPLRSASYRKSFRHYDEQRLLVSILFYGSNATLFFGAFMMRYREELILAFPAMGFVMAVYLWLAFKPNSAAQHPEGLYKEPVLMISVVGCAVLMAVLMFVDLPWLHAFFGPTIPPGG